MPGRKLAVVTGATGGIGQAIARLIGRDHDLVLADHPKTDLAGLARALADDGFYVSLVVPIDIALREDCDRLAQGVAELGPVDALLHAAGVSPGTASWRTILEVNLFGTRALLDVLKPHMAPGSATVVIASSAGHHFKLTPDIEAALAADGPEVIAERLGGVFPTLTGSTAPDDWGMTAYGLSKFDNIALCTRLAAKWGERGARIVSVSPGVIWTPMGRHAAAHSPRMERFLSNTPAGRWGTSQDVASLVEFLVSERGAFITGCDILIDGGLTAVLGQPAVSPAG